LLQSANLESKLLLLHISIFMGYSNLKSFPFIGLQDGGSATKT